MKKKVLAAIIAAVSCAGAVPVSSISLTSMAEKAFAEQAAEGESSLNEYAEAILEYMHSNSIQGGISHAPDEKLLTVSYRGNYGEQLKTFIDELGLDKSNIKYELEELPEFIAFSEPNAVTTPATTIAVTGTNTVTTITMPVVDDPSLITSVATVKIMDISGDVILVKPVDGSWELKSADKFTLSAKQLPADITPKTGMKLEITYNGGILETYPAMFGNIQKITVATETDTDKEGATWLKGTKDMTLKDVIELAKKGNDLDWSDFKDYNGRDVGSGLHIWEYKLEDGYVLDVGGDIMTKPMYILLKRNNDKSIDIRTDDVKEYIASSATPVSDNSKSIGEDSLSISEEIKEHFRVYETYSDENTKPERRLVQDFKSIMRYYNVPVRSAFTEYDNIDDILVSKYVLQKLYIVEQQDGSFKYYDEDLTEIKSSSSYLNIPEKAYTAFWDKDFVNKYISSNAKLENIYYISGEINQMGTAIYYKTTVGDYVYFYHYSIGEKLFSIEDFCKYQKAISDELAKHPNENDGSDIDISSIMDLSKYDLKNITSESERLKGDANCDGQVDLADAVMIMQALANPNKYGIDGTAEHHLTEQGKLNGDMDGDGLTVGDAQAIQRKLLGLDKEDVQKIESYLTANAGFLYESGSYTIFFIGNGKYFCRRGSYSIDKVDNGTYTISRDTVVLTGQFGTNRFRYEDNTLIYIEEGSDGFNDVKPKNGEKFYAVLESSNNTDTQYKLSDIVTIKTNYNPAMSDWSGIGILLEFDSPEYDISLEAADGQFVDWDIKKGSGPIKNAGKTYEIGKSCYVFWNPDDMSYTDGFETEITVKGTNKSKQVELGKIYITNKNSPVYTASLEKPGSSENIDSSNNEVNSSADYPCAIKINGTVFWQTNEKFSEDFSNYTINKVTAYSENGTPQNDGESNFDRKCTTEYIILDEKTIVVKLQDGLVGYWIFRTK